MSSSRSIPNDEAYEKTLVWMREKAKLLLDPLTLSADERRSLQQKYDFWEQRILEYNRGQRVLVDPGIKKIYKAAGVKYQEFISEEGQ